MPKNGGGLESEDRAMPGVAPTKLERVVAGGRIKIHVEGISKEYTDKTSPSTVLALNRIDVGIYDGEFFVLLGPSGCGKSTLLNIIAGFIPPTTGSIRLDGQEVAGPGPDRAVVFQEYALFPWKTVWQNIEIGPEVRKVPKAERLKICEYYIGLVGLRGFEDRFPAELSGGMKQRVGLARALANDPEVLLMDEPFGSLDAQTRRLMQRELLHIWQATLKTVVLVTHSVIEALLLADRLAVMTAHPGRIKELLPIELARPRDPTSDPFVAYQRRVNALIEDEVEAAWAQAEREQGQRRRR
ncbi:MAG: ABC transporter ATP-binding protein [Ardenticatenaceae bacterium]|nr:ABC transporter ATP-binding protein [Ardenticatenaceae bacterium]